MNRLLIILTSNYVVYLLTVVLLAMPLIFIASLAGTLRAFDEMCKYSFYLERKRAIRE